VVVMGVHWGGDTFIVITESAEAGTMLLAAIGNYVHDVAAVAELRKFVERCKRK